MAEDTSTTTVPRKERKITFVDTPVEIPPIVKESIYPWSMLQEHPPLSKSFFVECDSKEEAETLKPSVAVSGKNYYSKRNIPLRPIVRSYQMNETFGVMAWAAPESEDDSSEDEVEE